MLLAPSTCPSIWPPGRFPEHALAVADARVMIVHDDLVQRLHGLSSPAVEIVAVVGSPSGTADVARGGVGVAGDAPLGRMVPFERLGPPPKRPPGARPCHRVVGGAVG